ERRVGLDQPGESLAVGPAEVPGRDGLVHGLDRPGDDGGCAADAPGVADGDNGITGGHGRGVADGDGLEPRGALDLDDGDVVGGIGPHHGGVVGAAGVDQGDADVGGALDDVVVGEDLARGGQHHPGARPRPVLVTELGVDVDDAGGDL